MRSLVYVIAAGSAALAFAGVALAQSGASQAAPAVAAPPQVVQCGAMPAEPTLPNGADPATTRAQIEAGKATYEAYAAAAKAVLDCQRDQILARQAANRARSDAANAEVQRANDFVNVQWAASVAAYNTRTNPPPPPAEGEGRGERRN
jgi:hypothetical protein